MVTGLLYQLSAYLTTSDKFRLKLSWESEETDALVGNTLAVSTKDHNKELHIKEFNVKSGVTVSSLYALWKEV